MTVSLSAISASLSSVTLAVLSSSSRVILLFCASSTVNHLSCAIISGQSSHCAYKVTAPLNSSVRLLTVSLLTYVVSFFLSSQYRNLLVPNAVVFVKLLFGNVNATSYIALTSDILPVPPFALNDIV